MDHSSKLRSSAGGQQKAFSYYKMFLNIAENWNQLQFNCDSQGGRSCLPRVSGVQVCLIELFIHISFCTNEYKLNGQAPVSLAVPKTIYFSLHFFSFLVCCLWVTW